MLRLIVIAFAVLGLLAHAGRARVTLRIVRGIAGTERDGQLARKS